MVVWHSFLPFGLSIAACVFVSWKAVENQLELRDEGGSAAEAEEAKEEGEDEAATATKAPPQPDRSRPPRTASELRARLQTLSRLPPGPRRLARGKALALAAERALREASPEVEREESGSSGDLDDGEPVVFIESNTAAALRQTLPWLDARLAALASEDSRAERCGPCGICAGYDDACATHAWPCGDQNRAAGGGGREEGQSGGGNGSSVAGLLAALFGPSSGPSSSPSSTSLNSDSVFTTSAHRACGRCSAKCGSKCPWCRRENGAPRLAFLEAASSS